MKIRLHAFRKLVWGENVEKHGFRCFSGGRESYTFSHHQLVKDEQRVVESTSIHAAVV